MVQQDNDRQTVAELMILEVMAYGNHPWRVFPTRNVGERETQCGSPTKPARPGRPQPLHVSRFAIASAVVTEVGGSLSHAAVVPREYRIPAVVGAQSAMSLIGTGQLIEVDGSQGVVRV